MAKLLIAVITLVLTVIPVIAQQACAPIDEIQRSLAEQYGEAPVYAASGKLSPIVVFVNERTRTYTVIMIGDDGVGCFRGSGNDWHSLSERPRPPELPSSSL